MTKLVTCPETAHLEAIDCAATPDGVLERVLRCTRFDPLEAVACEMVCIERLNGRRVLDRARALGLDLARGLPVVDDTDE